jgi:hypothetical protein
VVELPRDARYRAEYRRQIAPMRGSSRDHATNFDSAFDGTWPMRGRASCPCFEGFRDNVDVLLPS